MKKILILLCVCFSIHATAQTQKEQVDKLVSREQVSTGILYNRIIPQAKLHTFGQNNQNDTSSYDHFVQAYYELSLSAYDNSKVHDLKQLRDWMRYKSERNTLILGVLNFEFNYSEDLTEEKLNEKKPVFPNLPKINKLSTFVGAILSEKPLIAGKSVQIELNENLIFGNYPQAIVSLLADFGEGKTHTFLKNGTYALHYATSGAKTIRLVGKFSDGTEKVTYTNIEVQNDQSTTARGSAVPACYVRDGTRCTKHAF